MKVDGATLFLICLICAAAAAFWRQLLAALAIGLLVVAVSGVVQIVSVLQAVR